MPHIPILSRDELAALVRRVFHLRPDDTGVAVLVDLPDRRTPDDDAWRDRRRLAHEWTVELAASDLGLPVRLSVTDALPGGARCPRRGDDRPIMTPS